MDTVCVLANLKLADPWFGKLAVIDVLLGEEICFKLLCAGQIRIEQSSLMLQKTLLGWIVSRRFSDSSQIDGDGNVRTYHKALCNIALQRQLEEFW